MTQTYKFPKIPHLPFSPGITNDDKIMNENDYKEFRNMDVVVTVKMDGENTTLYKDKVHARSIDSNMHHPSRTWVMNFHSTIKDKIPENYRICGENLYAKHSIEYNGLTSYFLGFAAFDQRNQCMCWKDTVAFLRLLDIDIVEVIYMGLYDEGSILHWYKRYKSYCGDTLEGFVVRNIHTFNFSEFGKNVAKYVRENHVQTDEHWMNQKIVKNGLRKKDAD